MNREQSDERQTQYASPSCFIIVAILLFLSGKSNSLAISSFCGYIEFCQNICSIGIQIEHLRISCISSVYLPFLRYKVSTLFEPKNCCSFRHTIISQMSNSQMPFSHSTVLPDAYLFAHLAKFCLKNLSMSTKTVQYLSFLH